ncbi:MAG: UDP-3-O-(3-hydroxymyristoyl)glucosamine N-acyltransferase [Acidobacteria bacterium]|nr:UDP-3-O-(3-hydroxymyristoyl)glucosamine N-acyltransferase [Acidobacteriota bacterium]
MYTLQKLAEHVGGRVAGDSQMEIRGIQPFESAGPGDLTLAAQKKYQEHLDQTRASAVIVSPGVESDEKPLLQVERPKVAFARLLALFHPRPAAVQGISPQAHISESSRVSEDVTIHPFVFVGDEVMIEKEVTLFSGVHVGNHCVIGRGCVLHPNVTLYESVFLGNRVILHSGTVIGADGFGYVFDGQTQVKIPQTGSVTIGDDVEIGANSCVDRAGFGVTVLERGVKLDNHVHIGHNCRIGENTVIAGQVGLSGSVEVGKNCTFAGHAGVVDHVKIGDQVTVMMKSAVSKDIPSQSVVSGQPAMEHRQWMKIEAATRRLPEIYREWKSWLKDNRK